MSEEDAAPSPSEPDVRPDGRVLSVHLGHSANCSSIGSVVDFLFLSSLAGGALLSVAAILLRERAGAASTAEASEPREEPGAAKGEPLRDEGDES